MSELSRSALSRSTTTRCVWLLSVWNMAQLDLRCAVDVEYAWNFKDVAWKKSNYLIRFERSLRIKMIVFKSYLVKQDILFKLLLLIGFSFLIILFTRRLRITDAAQVSLLGQCWCKSLLSQGSWWISSSNPTPRGAGLQASPRNRWTQIHS